LSEVVDLVEMAFDAVADVDPTRGGDTASTSRLISARHEE
jgi:hypothetical protein